jgi:HEPN domain-containing protein
MKTATEKQISELVSYYKTSAYAQTNEITELAKELIEEGEELEEVEQEILNDIKVSLEDYEYIECENQGSYRRHIWHKIEE